ncbi:MAG: proline--tRNA ligase [Acidimicrobiales bacterium]|jgi:prolyl-tRNA synthetase
MRMSMKMSQLLGTTLRDAPAGAETPGYQLLLRGAYIRQLGQGIFSYLPLAWRSMRRIEDIMREEMDAAGGVEMTMPLVHPGELWKRSGRYDTIGPEMIRFVDRRDRPLVLAMTHEEVVATLSATEIQSWRQLPKLVYHIQLKFRDDPRPRAGLLRVREFTMKDAYTLDLDEAGLDVQYNRLYDAYQDIFRRCELPVIAVTADVGMMGGSQAHEFMYLTSIGEDTLVLCDSCGYAQNRQVARAARPAANASDELLPLERVSTPGTVTIGKLCELLGIAPEQTAKVVFLATDSAQFVVAVVRGDMQVNDTKVSNLVKAAEVRPMTPEEISGIGCVPGYASPIGVGDRATVIVDDLVAESRNLVAGANEEGWHLLNVNVGRDYEPDIVADITAAEDGQPCVVCGSPLRTERGVEVGNIFKLGTKYSTSLGANYLAEDGSEKPIVMGSYGIGVGRLIASIAEEHRDDRGLCWPVSVAPFAAHLCALGDEGLDAAPGIVQTLVSGGIDVLLDDRGERPGVQFTDAELIGCPVLLTVSKRSLAAGGVEARLRAAEGRASEILPVDALVSWVRERLGAR